MTFVSDLIPAQKTEPPQIPLPARPLGLARFLWELIRNPIAAWPVQILAEPLYVQSIGRQKIVCVTEPELLRQVLTTNTEAFPKNPLERRLYGPLLGQSILTCEGDDWRWQRRTAAPLFTPHQIQHHVPAMVDAAGRVLASWRKAGVESTQPIDPPMMRATLEVVTQALMPEDDDFDMDALQRWTGDYLAASSWEIVYGILHLPAWLPHPRRRRALEAARNIRAAIRKVIEKRVTTGGAPDDLLGRLQDATDPATGCPMSRSGLLNNAVTFLIAGHETTYSTLTWALYLLARYPDWQDKLACEVHTATGDDRVSAGDIDRLPLCRAVLHETLRLYPPAPILSRMAVADVSLGGQTFPAGTMFFVPVYAIHRHPDYWPDPDSFNPVRFCGYGSNKPPRYGYLPWGAGPRTCIGAAFAMLEATTILATLLQEVRFGVADAPPPSPVARITLRPSRTMSLRVTFKDRGDYS